MVLSNLYVYIESYVEDADYRVSYDCYYAKYSVYMNLGSTNLIEIPVSERAKFESENFVYFLNGDYRNPCDNALELRRILLGEQIQDNPRKLTILKPNDIKKLDK